MPNLLSPGAHYAGLFNDAILSFTGAPVVNSPVTVYQSDGSTVATLYTDQTKGTTTSNPVSTDNYGNLLFYTNPGRYVLSFNVGGTPTTKNVMVDAWFADAGWNYYTTTASVSAPVSGDSIESLAVSAIAITAPPPAVGARFRITNGGSSPITVTHNSTEVFLFKGSTAAGVTSFNLSAPGSTATLECHNGTNWNMTAGEQDSWWQPFATLGYINSWADNAGPTGGACYRLQGNEVRFAGSFKSGASNSQLTSSGLPAAMRPPYTGLSVGANNGAPGYGYLSISTAGVITVVYSGNSTIILDDAYFNVD